jgi:phosphocarrier protein HPr
MLNEDEPTKTLSFIIPHSSFRIWFSMPIASRELVVSNKLGLHARPAMQFVDLANQFQSKVTVYKGGEEPAEADGKSVMQMIILAATEGTPMRIDAEGEDAQAAVEKLAELFESKFGEGE